jgi:Uma2 family endonuclease
MGTVTMLPRARPFTVEDLDAMPDDGNRYELIDGALIVTPAPGDAHQGVLGSLHVLLRQACPPELRVRLAPYDVKLAADTLVQPDLLVAPKASLVERGLFGPPSLAVEIQSPSTKAYDRGMKFVWYAAAGIASYWIVDPVAPRLVAWQLVDGEYVEVADVAREESWTAEAPYSVTIRPADLPD